MIGVLEGRFELAELADPAFPELMTGPPAGRPGGGIMVGPPDGLTNINCALPSRFGFLLCTDR
jgi:hypothetical protein